MLVLCRQKAEGHDDAACEHKRGGSREKQQLGAGLEYGRPEGQVDEGITAWRTHSPGVGIEMRCVLCPHENYNLQGLQWDHRTLYQGHVPQVHYAYQHGLNTPQSWVLGCEAANLRYSVQFGCVTAFSSPTCGLCACGPQHPQVWTVCCKCVHVEQTGSGTRDEGDP